MHILCRLFGHRRNKRRIIPWREGWQTECSLCSARLARVRHGQWEPIGAMRVTSDAAWQAQIESPD
jgi:hypothetical protein